MKSQLVGSVILGIWISAGLVLIAYQLGFMSNDPAAVIVSLPPSAHIDAMNRMKIPHPQVRQKSNKGSKSQLSEINHNHAYSNSILIDWHYHSNQLSYLNYKSLESFLSCCYTTTNEVEAMIIGSNLANYYKLEGILRLVSQASSLYAYMLWLQQSYLCQVR
jgi:hypothetical protein